MKCFEKHLNVLCTQIHFKGAIEVKCCYSSVTSDSEKHLHAMEHHTSARFILVTRPVWHLRGHSVFVVINTFDTEQ